MTKRVTMSMKYAIYTGPILAFIAILLFSKEVVSHGDGTITVIRGWNAILSMLKHDPASFFAGIVLAAVCMTVFAFIVFHFLGVWINYKRRNHD